MTKIHYTQTTGKLSFIVAVILLTTLANVKAETRLPWSFTVIQGLTHSSDTVVTATIESVVVGQRGDSRKETTDTRVKCKVNDVYLGNKEIKGKYITVLFGAADSPIREKSKIAVLLFLQTEGKNYRLPFFDRYGVFGLKKGIVQAVFESDKKFEGEFHSLPDIISRVKKYAELKVEFQAETKENILLSDSYLPVKFTFKNIGEKPVLILPPSYCFNSLQVTKRFAIIDGSSDDNWWHSVLHWDFLTELEPLSELKVGEERIYDYQIPYKQLNINKIGEYKVDFDYHPYQLSSWSDKANITKEQMQNVWLGVPKQTAQIVSVK